MAKKYSLARPKKADLQLMRARASIARARMKSKRMENSLVEGLSTVSAGAAIAELERHAPAEFLNIPTKLWFAALSYVGAAYVGKGFLSSFFKGLGDANLAVYAYKVSTKIRAGESQPFVAGYEDYGNVEYPSEDVGAVGYYEEA